MSDEQRLTATPSQTVGPFFHFGLATDAALGDVARFAETGERIQLRIRVLDGDGAPVPDALIELYHADASGDYRRPHEPAATERTFTGFGRLATDEAGLCVFETIRPGAVGVTISRAQAPHVTVCLFARGLLRHLYTRVYFAGDPGHDVDPVLALVPADRVQTLIANRAADRADTWDFVIRLQGEKETVFFDF